jgi:hypothetical protein
MFSSFAFAFHSQADFRSITDVPVLKTAHPDETNFGVTSG